MRYQFIQRTKETLKEGQDINMVPLLDKQMGTIVAELYIEHAQIIAMMYSNLSKHNEFAADEFMYGHLMGMTYTMLHADKYPKIKTSKGPHGEIIMTMTQPDGNEKTYGDVVKIPGTGNVIQEQLERVGIIPPVSGNKG